jgi:hypothetical protein
MDGDKLVVICGKCEAVVRVPAAAAGKVGRCPKCGAAVGVPAAVANDASIDLGKILAPPVIAMSAPPPPVPQPKPVEFVAPSPGPAFFRRQRASWWALVVLVFGIPAIAVVRDFGGSRSDAVRGNRLMTARSLGSGVEVGRILEEVEDVKLDRRSDAQTFWIVWAVALAGLAASRRD